MVTKRPLFRDLTDEGLVEAYVSTKALLFNASQLRASRQVFALLRDLDIVVGVARKRGLRLPPV
jgi:hypothetical protein